MGCEKRARDGLYFGGGGGVGKARGRRGGGVQTATCVFPRSERKMSKGDVACAAAPSSRPSCCAATSSASVGCSRLAHDRETGEGGRERDGRRDVWSPRNAPPGELFRGSRRGPLRASERIGARARTQRTPPQFISLAKPHPRSPKTLAYRIDRCQCSTNLARPTRLCLYSALEGFPAHGTPF